jgi:VCBS repeat-containing protein
MSIGKHPARIGAAAGAAALALGLSLAGLPGSLAVAAADSPDTVSADTVSAEADTNPARSNRAARDQSRTGRPTTPVQADIAESGEGPGATGAAKAKARRGTTGTAAAPDTDATGRPTTSVPRIVGPAVAVPPVNEPLDAEPPATWAPDVAVPAQPPAPILAPATHTSVRPARTRTPPEVTEAPAAVAAAPRALATVSAPAGAAASSFADVLGELLGPIQALFDGAALLVRRTLFNEAPLVDPIQLTSQSEGPITGSLGAVDPEDDPLSFTITDAPRYGTVAIDRDGAYTYTPGPSFAGADSFSVTAVDTGFHVNLLDLFRPAGTSATVSVARGAPTPVLRFQFVYGSGSLFWSPQARTALETAATRLTSHFVVSAPVTITYRVTGEYSPLSATLAEAGSGFASAGTGFLQTLVQSKIQTGVDANGSAPDGSISWNFGPSWGLGTQVPGSQYDFQSIAMHELLHTLGFLSYLNAPGANTGRTWTAYDSFLVNSAGQPVIGPGGIWNTAYNANLTGGNDGVYFGGPNAVAANNGRVPLYTPSSWVSGSSVSHLSDFVFTGSRDMLMNAVISRGPAPRVLSPVELGILRDLGYTVNPGPVAL